ncbi:MAG: LacI family DNA-binding transcriptional regulator [Armatimonas sp.]
MAGRQAVTIKDVAERAGVSLMTVSAVLNGKASERRISTRTQERVNEIAAEMGYKPNHLARSLVTGRSGALGLVFPYSSAFIDHNPFSTAILSGVMAAAVQARWNLMLHTATGDDWNAVDSGDLIDPRVDGLLLVLPTPHSPLVGRCQREKFPCVSLVYSADSPDICTVNADDYHGGRLATEHLLALGHRRIAHLAGAPLVSTSAPRIEGYLSALRDAGITPDPALIVPANFSQPGGRAAMKALLDQPEELWPTAVFAGNDVSALGVLEHLNEIGLRVPEDIALVGYDDSYAGQLAQPPLTSVRMPIYEMAQQATNLLISLIEGKEITQLQPVLPVSLTIRHSSGPHPASSFPTKETDL